MIFAAIFFGACVAFGCPLPLALVLFVLWELIARTDSYSPRYTGLRGPTPRPRD